MSGNSSSPANRFTSKRGSILNALSSSAADIQRFAPRLSFVLGSGGTFESSGIGVTFSLRAIFQIRRSRFSTITSKFRIAGRKSR